MAGATGLEPATFGVTGRHSNQLSYAPAAVPKAGDARRGPMYGGTPHLSSSVGRVDCQCPLRGSAWRSSFRRRSLATAPPTTRFAFLPILFLLILRPILPRLGACPLQFFGRQLAVMVGIKLIEQGIRRGGKFGVVNATVLVPIHHRRGGGLIGINPRLIDLGSLLGIQATIVLGVMGGKFRFQAFDQLVAADGAVVIGVVFEQHGGIAAVIIFITWFFGRSHPGRRLARPAAGGERQSAEQNQEEMAQREISLVFGTLTIGGGNSE